jgi:3-oxoacyl-[acyl-carrier-protein] synthase-3
MIGLISTGISVGKTIQTNNDLYTIVKNFDISKSNKTLDEWLVEHYGIKSRVKSDQLPSDLAKKACEEALRKANIDVKDIDFLILNTVSGDYNQPTTATFVQDKIGMRKDSFAIEINMPCAGNIYGIATAYSYIKSGIGKLGLVVGVDKMSSIINEEDFKIAGMFGDAASACIVGKEPTLEVKNIFLKSKADHDLSLGKKSSGSKFPLTKETINKKEHLLNMKGKETAIFIKETVKKTIQKLLDNSRLDKEEVDQLIIHQASKRLIEQVVHEMGFKSSQAHFTVDNYGNTSSASILLTLDDYLKINKNAKNIFLIGMGSGLNWGGIYLRKT